MMRTRSSQLASALAAALVLSGASAGAFDVVLNAQNEYLDAYFFDATGLHRKVFIHPEDPALGGRHVNGKLCFFPPTYRDRSGVERPNPHAGRFAIADDTYREACVDTRAPQERCTPGHPDFVGTDADGWGVFEADGSWAREVIQADWRFPGDPQALGTVDPQGCVFDHAGNLWGNDVGGGAIGVATGGIVVFFADSGVDAPGHPREAYSQYCFVARELGSPGMPAIDAGGSIYFPQATGNRGPLHPLSDFTGQPEFSADAGRVTKLTLAQPLTVNDCAPSHELTATGRAKIQRNDEFLSFPTSGVITPESIAAVPAGFELAAPGTTTPHWYVGSVLLPPAIDEYDASGRFVRNVVAPFLPRNPLGMDVSPKDGSLYFAELSLTPAVERDEDGSPSGFDPFATGCGRLSMVRFQNGVPLPPTVLRENLLFPDGVSVVDSSRFAVDFAARPDVPEQSASDCGPE